MKNGSRKDPLQKAIDSALNEFWTLRPEPDVRRLVSRAIKENGRDKNYWIAQCVRAGLAKYAGKKDQAATA